MSTINYRELVSWQKSMDMVTAVYKLTKKLPREEAFSLTDQIRRAAVSVPSNIAEGCERRSPKEYASFLSMALASNAELQTQLEICVRVEYLTREEIKDIYKLSREISKILSKTITTLQNK